MRKYVLYAVLLFFMSDSLWAQDSGDQTGNIEKLGSPYKQKYASGPRIYARNIWVIKEYLGKIYLGAGNSSNEGPASNAGPVPVIAFDPASGKFKTEWTVPDEQIDVYRVFSDGLLYIPGHDPKESWELGNFYRRKKDGSWEKIRTMPKGVHNYDMAEFNKELFAGGYGVGVTGSDWTVQMELKPCSGGRVYSFFVFPDKLFAVAAIVFPNSKMKNKDGRAMVSVYTKGKQEFKLCDMDMQDVMPGTEVPDEQMSGGKAVRPTPFQKKVLYIAGLQHNDHQIKPLGAYAATASGDKFKAKKINIPAGAVPWDIKVRDGKAYVLFAVADKSKPDVVTNHVWSSVNGESFSPLFSFKASTFARSFEYYDGYFYFGMGTEIEDGKNWTQAELKEECGEIYRIPFNGGSSAGKGK